ncbi:dATP / dGTP pyrophosphohydrolase [Vibrio phage D148]
MSVLDQLQDASGEAQALMGIDGAWDTKKDQGQALRYNSGKPELSFLLSAPHAMTGLAEVFAEGAKKYPRNNWKKGFPKDQLVDSLLRHLMSYQNGEEVDEETGCCHLDHVLWNAMALSDEYNGKREAYTAKG